MDTTHKRLRTAIAPLCSDVSTSLAAPLGSLPKGGFGCGSLQVPSHGRICLLHAQACSTGNMYVSTNGMLSDIIHPTVSKSMAPDYNLLQTTPRSNLQLANREKIWKHEAWNVRQHWVGFLPQATIQILLQCTTNRQANCCSSWCCRCAAHCQLAPQLAAAVQVRIAEPSP